MGTFQHGGWRRLNHSANGAVVVVMVVVVRESVVSGLDGWDRMLSTDIDTGQSLLEIR